jgi:hypothetical protein
VLEEIDQLDLGAARARGLGQRQRSRFVTTAYGTVDKNQIGTHRLRERAMSGPRFMR